MNEEPPPCDNTLFNAGETAGYITGPRAQTIEYFVKKVRYLSQQEVDWHYVGGRAVVRYLGDRDRVVRTIEEILPLLVYSHMVCPDNFGPASEDDVQWTVVQS